MPDLARASGAYAVHSRIAELRTKRGLDIETRIETHGRVKRSFYRLNPTTQPAEAGTLTTR